MCERCGLRGTSIGEFHCAHIVDRSWAATRTDLNNGLCMCPPCHRWLDDKIERGRMKEFVGAERYVALAEKARGGVRALGLSPLMFWRGERQRLTRIAKELGL
jgi:hypothetical protein